ncbi:DUF427 domain-containing protein [Peterkaempfera bronchialis]|uniref:DUF427 domain-containing protein n=1 Tax=Peterkaempfera bronchialis TaxID=2126346 RepID=A0A345T3A5_9ACTN|nr:DUF427 domain-containing protein [Peterkaempfera bronchialis]AXI80460.1 DUF427 domain-containing protein [Peterkaempfera bronchialis]
MATEPAQRLRIEAGSKRVRAFLGGHPVADTLHPVLVWEVPYYPAYYFPLADVRAELLEPTGRTAADPGLGDGRLFTVRAGGRTAPDAARRYQDSPVEALRELVRLDWDAMDAWFEEDEEVFTHPRSPYTRVDILPSSRRVRVEIEGTQVAESRSPRVLFETGLPPRFYLPKTDVRLDLLEPSDTVSHCPYKGRADHLSARIGGRLLPDVAWTYPTPLPESARIAGLVCFYDTRAEIHLD